MVKPLKELLIVEMRQRQQKNEFYVDDLVVHYTADVITKEFRKALKQIGAYSKGSAVYVLRHTAATAILEATGDLRMTQEIMGHSQITTTEIYAHIAEKEIEEAVNIAFQ